MIKNKDDIILLRADERLHKRIESLTTYTFGDRRMDERLGNKRRPATSVANIISNTRALREMEN